MEWRSVDEDKNTIKQVSFRHFLGDPRHYRRTPARVGGYVSIREIREIRGRQAGSRHVIISWGCIHGEHSDWPILTPPSPTPCRSTWRQTSNSKPHPGTPVPGGHRSPSCDGRHPDIAGEALVPCGQACPFPPPLSTRIVARIVAKIVILATKGALPWGSALRC